MSELCNGNIDNDYSHPADQDFLGKESVVGIGADVLADAENSEIIYNNKGEDNEI